MRLRLLALLLALAVCLTSAKPLAESQPEETNEGNDKVVEIHFLLVKLIFFFFFYSAFQIINSIHMLSFFSFLKIFFSLGR